VLELDDLRIVQVQEGVRRPAARARLVYAPATRGRREVASDKTWRFVAPLGPLEADDLRWYLEKFRRARSVRAKRATASRSCASRGLLRGRGT
jgi:hypothetical protein